MGRTRGTNGTEENCILLIGKPEIDHLKNIRCRWVDNNTRQMIFV